MAYSDTLKNLRDNRELALPPDVVVLIDQVIIAVDEAEARLTAERIRVQGEFEAALEDPEKSVQVVSRTGASTRRSRWVIVRHTKARVWLNNWAFGKGTEFDLKTGNKRRDSSFDRTYIDWSAPMPQYLRDLALAAGNKEAGGK